MKYQINIKMQGKLFFTAVKQSLLCNKLFLNSAQITATMLQTKMSFKNRKKSQYGNDATRGSLQRKQYI